MEKEERMDAAVRWAVQMIESASSHVDRVPEITNLQGGALLIVVTRGVAPGAEDPEKDQRLRSLVVSNLALLTPIVECVLQLGYAWALIDQTSRAN